MNLTADLKVNSTKLLVMSALFGVISYLIMFIEINIPFMPYFLRLDFSDIPAMIMGLSFGPLPGVLVVFLKNFLQIFTTATMGIGEITNFLVGGSLVLSSSYLFYKKKYSLTTSLILGSLIMTFMAVVINLIFVIPLYELLLDLPLTEIIEMAGAINPLVSGLSSYVIFVLIPFNLLKAGVLSTITKVIYPRVITYISAKN